MKTLISFNPILATLGFLIAIPFLIFATMSGWDALGIYGVLTILFSHILILGLTTILIWILSSVFVAGYLQFAFIIFVYIPSFIFGNNGLYNRCASAEEMALYYKTVIPGYYSATSDPTDTDMVKLEKMLYRIEGTWVSSTSSFDENAPNTVKRNPRKMFEIKRNAARKWFSEHDYPSQQPPSDLVPMPNGRD